MERDPRSWEAQLARAREQLLRLQTAENDADESHNVRRPRRTVRLDRLQALQRADHRLRRVIAAAKRGRTWAWRRSSVQFGDVALDVLARDAAMARRLGEISIVDELFCAAALHAAASATARLDAVLTLYVETVHLIDVGAWRLSNADALLIKQLGRYLREACDPPTWERAWESARTTLAHDAQSAGITMQEAARRRWGREHAIAPIVVLAEHQKQAARPSDEWNAPKRSIAVESSRRRTLHRLYHLLFEKDLRTVQRTTPVLNDDDVTLALSWQPVLLDEFGVPAPLGGRRTSVATLQARMVTTPALRRNFTLGQLLSARAAEKVAMAYYSALGAQVRDISVTQLTRGEQAWTTHDLEVDGRFIDIKNARSNPDYPNRYTEHLVPRFKEVRRATAEHDQVAICGVFSPYLWPGSLLVPGDDYAAQRPVTVLGETSLRRLRAVAERFAHTVALRFSNKLGDARTYLPPWVFEYPERHYAERDRALAECRAIDWSALTPSDVGALNVWPLALAAGVPLPDEFQGTVSMSTRGFVARWHDHRDALGLSLPALFLAILEHLVLSARQKEPEPAALHVSELARMVFPTKQHRFVPLGIHDPLAAVWTLLETMKVLTAQTVVRLQEIESFTLHGLRVLRGTRRKSPSSISLIAYCGRCGSDPLVIGRAELCRCGYLRCTEADCGFCREGCPECPARSASDARRQ